jgi:protein-S-isoprenylcysteine O-methyltransferase Ste14
LKVFEKQTYQALSFILLFTLVWFVSRVLDLEGSLFGIDTSWWLWLSIAAAGLHQVYAVLFWRGELYYQFLTRRFGKNAFRVWAIGFLILFFSRPGLIVGLAAANQNTLSIPVWMGFGLGIIVLIPGIYLIDSIQRYFGYRRALGEDHFLPDEYREKPLVKEGIFRWTNNAMYIFGFLVLWAPGFFLRSQAALIAAAFNQIFIWAHYYFTELPDMNHIYGKFQSD